MSDPTLPDRLRRMAAELDRHHDTIGAATIREAAGVIERVTAEIDGPLPPRADPAPVHARRETWPECINAGCTTPVDPWDRNTRCPAHRPPPDAPLTVTRHTRIGISADAR